MERPIRMVLKRSVPKKLCQRAAAILVIPLVLLSACGDPAPGEGMEQPMMQETMPEVVAGPEAINSVEIPGIDLGTLTSAEIDKVLPDGPRCMFSYSAEGPPILAATPVAPDGAQGVVKIHGRLVEVRADSVNGLERLAADVRFTAEDIRLDIKPDPDDAGVGQLGQRMPADMEFELEQGLQVGYRGWYKCEADPQ